MFVHSNCRFEFCCFIHKKLQLMQSIVKLNACDYEDNLDISHYLPPTPLFTCEERLGDIWKDFSNNRYQLLLILYMLIFQSSLLNNADLSLMLCICPLHTLQHPGHQISTYIVLHYFYAQKFCDDLYKLPHPPKSLF